MTVANSHLLKYYSENDRVARDRFLMAAKSFVPDGELGSFAVPSAKANDLFTDFLYLKPRSQYSKLLVLTSGVHGIEAPTGSAIQLQFLTEILPHLKREDLGILVVHVLNPFGFRFKRRNTEANVNLNRCFSATDELYKTENSGYEKLASEFSQTAPVRAGFSFFRTMLRLLRLLTVGGFSASELNQSIAQGQYRHPTGLEFGGFKPEPQVAFLSEKLKSILPQYKDVILLDLHTGLGHAQELHLIPGDNPGCVDSELFEKLIGKIKEPGLFEFTRGDAKGFYRTTGDLNSIFPEIVKSNGRVLALTMEFGTLGNGTFAKIDMLDRVLSENQGYNAGFKNEKDREIITARFTELFNPEDLRWRANALSRACIFIQGICSKIDKAGTV